MLEVYSRRLKIRANSFKADREAKQKRMKIWKIKHKRIRKEEQDYIWRFIRFKALQFLISIFNDFNG